MGKYYQAKKTTGNEYVFNVMKFETYTLHTLEKLPKDWKDYYLDPIAEIVKNIKIETVEANAVYMKSKDKEFLLKAYTDRITHLSNALRKFSSFDESFDLLMRKVDLLESERARLRGILCQLLKDEGFGLETPVKQASASKDKPVIEIHGRINEIEYVSAGVSEKFKIGLTTKNRDYWLELEEDAKNGIAKRLASDRSIYKNLVNEKSVK